MANNLSLFYNKSDDRVVSKKLTTIYDAEIKLLDNTDMIRPEISLASDIDLKKCNYMYIADFHRFYYIDSIEYEHQRYFIKGRVDVLSSIYPFIKDKTVISKRSANLFNLYINDDRLNLRAETRTLTIPFPGGFERVGGGKDFDFVLTVNGGGVNS